MNQEILSEIVNSSMESIVITDYLGGIIYCNKSCEELLEPLSVPLPGDNIYTHFSEDDHQKIKSILRLLKEESHPGFAPLLSFKKPIEAKGRKVNIKKLNVGNTQYVQFTRKGNIELDMQLQKYTKSGYILIFEVKDTGIGISKDKIKHIFNPFHQANTSTRGMYGGTGLGLSIVQNLIEIQNGTIEVRSEENVGSVFTITLPFKNSDKSLPVSSLATSDNIKLRWKMNLNILYVEDVTTNQVLMEEILSDWGVKVEMASDGHKALKLIEEKKYDLILMDIQMPGIDGLETAQRIRAMEGPYFKNVPIFALTASTSGSIKEKIIKSGMQGIITKPVNIDDLRAKIVEYSSIIDDTKAQKKLDEKIRGAEIETSIIFERTDQLFLSNLIKYQEFLKMTINEFKINLELLNRSIQEENQSEYRQLRHRMKSLIITFGMKELLELLNKIREKFATGPLSSNDKHEFIHDLDHHVNFLIDRLTNKLASLKWQ